MGFGKTRELLYISPDEHIVQQVENLFNINKDQLDEEVSKRIVCSIENDLFLIHKSLPLSPSFNPFEALNNDVAEDVLNKEEPQGLVSSPRSPLVKMASPPLGPPIAQVKMKFPIPLVSPGRGRPPKNCKTQLEIDASIQQVLSTFSGVKKVSTCLWTRGKMVVITQVLPKRKRSAYLVLWSLDPWLLRGA